MGAWFTPRVLLSIAFLGGCSSEALTTDEPEAEPVGEGRVVEVVGAEPSKPSVPISAQPNYPAGPYGTAKGATIADLSFVGWHNPTAAGYDVTKFETVRLSDFYNPAKSEGAPRVLVLNSSAVWCTVCRAEYTHLSRDQVYANYRPKGIEILGVLFEDNDGFSARPQDLTAWSDAFQVPFPMGLDPGFKSGVYFDSDATPMNMIIDTSNMKILDVTMGFDARTPEQYWASIEQWLSR
jgi:hypothetical protein